MKQAEILFLTAIALLLLMSVSCTGAAQPTGGWSGPAVHDGILYAGTRDGRVVAINASTQEVLWRWPDATGVRSLIYATPIVQGDLVYVGTYGGQVYALTSVRGAERWVSPRIGSIGAIVGRLVVVNETIYATSSDGSLYALDATNGDLKWKSEPLGDKLWTSPSVIGDTLYVSTFEGRIYALSTETGQFSDWSFQSEAGFASSPVIGEDVIYVGSFDRHLYAVRIGDSEPLWEFPGRKWFWAAPLISDGVVYAGCLDGRLYAIETETGEKLWEFEAASPLVSSPVLINNLLAVIDELGTVYVFDLSTESGDEAVPARTIPVGASVRSPVCTDDDLIYVTGENNSIYGVDIEIGEIADGWPVSLTAES